MDKIASTVNQARIIEAPPGIKDPNEMYQQSGAGFEEWLRELMAEAPLWAPPEPDSHQSQLL